MKSYMVMECHLSYAVVLDEEGRFLKVANRHYEVGQTVTDVIEMQVPQSVPQKKKSNKWMYSLTAMAACVMLMFTSVFQLEQVTYASVYMTINPEVRIDVNKKDIVVGLDGINEDGDDLIEGYNYKKKDLDLVMDELIDKAIDMGYLHEGGQISLELDAESNAWIVSHQDTLTTHLNEYLNEKLTVTIDVTEKNVTSKPIIIPIDPSESDYSDSATDKPLPNTPPSVTVRPNDSDYGDSSYGDSNYGDQMSDYDDQDDYDSDDDDSSDYDSDDEDFSDYDSEDEDDNSSDYGEDDSQDSSYGESDYEYDSPDTSASDYNEAEDSLSDYEDDSDDDSDDSDDDSDDDDSSDYDEDDD